MKKADIPIPVPCNENWDTMSPEGRKRFCDKCKKHVYDLSKMGEAAAREVLARRVRDDLCVSFLFDTYGNVVFEMVDTRIVAPSSLVRAKRAALAAAATLAVTTTMACAGAGNNGGTERLGGAPPIDEGRTTGEPPQGIDPAHAPTALPSATSAPTAPVGTTPPKAAPGASTAPAKKPQP